MPTLSFAFGSTSDPIHLAKSWSAVPVLATASSSRARSGPARASLPVASITCRKSGTRCAASMEISHQILIGARIRPFVSSKKPGDRSSRPVMLSSRRGSGAKERMKSGNSASPTVCAPRGIDCHVPISSDSKIQIRKTFRRFPKSTRFPVDRPFRSIASTRCKNSLTRARSRVPRRKSRSAAGDRGRESRYMSGRSDCIRCTNRRPPSRGHRPRRRACRGHCPSRFSLVAWDSHRNPTAALVPPELAELLEALELFRREDRTVQAHELVVQRACGANPDPALHVPFDARLNRDFAFLREVHDGLHHPLAPARQDLVKLLPVDELLGKGRCESGEAAGPVVGS